MTEGTTVPRLRPWANPAAIVYAFAVAAALPVFATIVWPVLNGAARPAHAGHWLLVSLHAISGTLTVILGFAGLFIGWTRLGFAYHRHVGCGYLGFGLTMATVSLWLSLPSPHPVKSLGVSTATLSIVWIAVALMGWRAGHNRRFGSHRDWMIRSVVLTWTFVFCRLAQQVPVFGFLGPEATTAGIWLYWVGPLIIAEVALQWRRGAAAASAAA